VCQDKKDHELGDECQRLIQGHPKQDGGTHANDIDRDAKQLFYDGDNVFHLFLLVNRHIKGTKKIIIRYIRIYLVISIVIPLQVL
jgi:hypothetical protein